MLQDRCSRCPLTVSQSVHRTDAYNVFVLFFVLFALVVVVVVVGGAGEGGDFDV